MMRRQFIMLEVVLEISGGETIPVNHCLNSLFFVYRKFYKVTWSRSAHRANSMSLAHALHPPV
jgi:hypothetical protein